MTAAPAVAAAGMSTSLLISDDRSPLPPSPLPFCPSSALDSRSVSSAIVNPLVLLDVARVPRPQRMKNIAGRRPEISDLPASPVRKPVLGANKIGARGQKTPHGDHERPRLKLFAACAEPERAGG